MSTITQKEAARSFAEFWKGKGYEKGQSQPFWLSLLREVYGVEKPETYITFEDQVHLDNTSFIDGYIDSTHVIIEQKSLGKELLKKIKQSNGALLTPYEQAKRYSMELPYSKRPRWIVTSNFESFLVYDMERPGAEPQLIYLKDLPEEYWRLEFLIDDEKHRIQREQDISEDAGKIIKVLYDALAVCYGDMDDPVNQKSLNKLIVRLVFCLYAEDSEMFTHGQFQDYVKHFDADDLSDALYNLFKVLDIPEEERRRGLKAILAAFPYTNGGLFHDKPDADDTEIPPLTDEVKRIIIEEAAPFNWSAISPTIFGGIFESTLNPETRRKGGMHYTSIENIHKVIDPLFLDDLKVELDNALDIKVKVKRKEALQAFQDKIAGLTFLDPACGSGNFLTETYLSLRRLENKVIKALFGEGMLGFDLDLIKVSIQQFYGIEINDFAVSVATTALWISETQMLRETESIIAHSLPVLPLKSYTHIHEGNALRMDWNDVINCKSLNYCFGNPPFVGYAYQNKEQKADLAVVCPECGKNIDYVVGWYYKSARMMAGTKIHAALVSTNSITQGEQVSVVWKPLLELLGVRIDFAHRTFRWDNEASLQAHVHCVIVGFSAKDSVIGSRKKLMLFDGDKATEALNISPYLLDAPTVFIDRRTDPLCDVPPFVRGCQPTDDGNLILTEEERAVFLEKEPQAGQFIRPFMMGKDFLQRKPRYCIWLVGADPAELRKCPLILERVAKVRAFRLSSTKAATRVKADVPTLFDEIREPVSNYVGFPTVSSEKRKYVPIDYLDRSIVPGNKIYFMEGASLYHFAVIDSIVHMAWMRYVCGRLEMRYNYSNTIVYNNFPWPSPTDAQKARIEATAQAILDARALYPESSLADLYDDLTMPVELRKAHRANDVAVMEAYGFRKDLTEPEIVGKLFKMYQRLVNKA